MDVGANGIRPVRQGFGQQTIDISGAQTIVDCDRRFRVNEQASRVNAIDPYGFLVC